MSAQGMVHSPTKVKPGLAAAVGIAFLTAHVLCCAAMIHVLIQMHH